MVWKKDTLPQCYARVSPVSHLDERALGLGELSLCALLLVVHECAQADAEVHSHGEHARPHGLDEQGARLVADVDQESKRVGTEENLHARVNQNKYKNV